MKLSQAPSGIV